MHLNNMLQSQAKHVHILNCTKRPESSS